MKDGKTTYPAHDGVSVPNKPNGEFEEVALCHLDIVYRIAVRLAGDTHEAEDLVQETFLRAHRAFGRFELRKYGARPWLLKILHNVFYSRRSQAGKAPTLMEDLSFDDFAAELEQNPPQILSEEQMDWEDFDEELKSAVESLAPEYRSVILLWALGDLSYKEIAQVMGCAMGTVMSRLHRARQQLNRTLGSYADDRGVLRKPDARQ